MVKTPRRLAAIAAFALALPGASSAAISGLKWTLEEGVSISGDILAAELADPSGSALVRFQLTRSGRNDDLAEYAAWVDSRLDHLVAVLGPARARHLTPCRQPGKGDGEGGAPGGYRRMKVVGANIAGFVKVADAMLAQGLV